MLTHQKSVNKTSSILELDTKFIAQQLTAIDLVSGRRQRRQQKDMHTHSQSVSQPFISLSISFAPFPFITKKENFLTLKPYTLLSNVRSKTKIEAMIKNFNLLSRHVIITILQHST